MEGVNVWERCDRKLVCGGEGNINVYSHVVKGKIVQGKILIGNRIDDTSTIVEVREVAEGLVKGKSVLSGVVVKNFGLK